MLRTDDIFDKNFDLLPIDPFWNFGDVKELKMHRIHAYPAKFPPFITTKAVEYANRSGLKVNRIADVFCGCGTAALEAKRLNINFYGCDINPVATLITRVKSRKYKDKQLRKYLDKVLLKFTKIENEKVELEKINERIAHWYFEDQILDLIKLKESINRSIPRGFYRDFFVCAFSNILKSTSRWLTKSIKPQLDPNKKPADVIEKYKEQVEFMIKANLENDIVNSASESIIENRNFLKLNIEQSFVDMIVTSPPYVTSYEYADLHQLSTLWLGYARDYRTLRNGTIGSLYHYSNFTDDMKKLNSISENIIYRLFSIDKNKAKSVAKYFVDLSSTISKCWKMLNSNGLALFVIGNTEYKGIKIDNAKYLVECMIREGFTKIDVSRRKISYKILTPFRDEKGKFTTNANSRKVYSEEFIIIGKKI